MQPLEMILGFNKDEGLHVIIDLLMDPTNDTNFRQVTLWNEWNYYFLAQGARKLGNPWTQNALWPARGWSHRRCGCAGRRGDFLFLLVLFHVVGFVLDHKVILFAAEFTSSVCNLVDFHRWPSSTWDQVDQRTMTSSTSRLMETKKWKLSLG